MSAPNSPSNTTEQASWIHSPQPGKLESLRKFVSTRANMLFDGAYFGFNGESILMPKFIPEMNALGIHTQKPSRGKIIAINPGAKKISRLLSLSREGNSIALLKAKGGYEKISHVEAENANLVREVDYAEIFRYLGWDELERMMTGYGMLSEVFEEIFPWMRNLPNTAFQVTKEGQKSGILLVNEQHQPNIRPPFFGGPGTLRRKRYATEH